jgi:hypothetical protein
MVVMGDVDWDAIWDGAEAELARLFAAAPSRDGDVAPVVELRPVEDEPEGDDRE